MLSYCPMGPMGKCNSCCPIPSHPMGHFPWDSHGNPIPMDKSGNLVTSKPKKEFSNLFFVYNSKSYYFY